MMFPIYQTTASDPGGYIESTLKVNGLISKRQIWLLDYETKIPLRMTISKVDNGKYSFQRLPDDAEFNIVSSDHIRQYRDAILTAVKPKPYD